MSVVRLPPCHIPQTPGEPVDLWVPLGKDEFSNEDGCVSPLPASLPVQLCRHHSLSRGCAACERCTTPAVGLLHSYSSPNPLTSATGLQGGGFGEVHLRVTYWPFELMRGHMGGWQAPLAAARLGHCGSLVRCIAHGVVAQHNLCPITVPPMLPALSCRGQVWSGHRHGAQVRLPASVQCHVPLSACLAASLHGHLLLAI